MENLSNIDLFNGIVGKIFSILYQNFPQEVEIDLGNFLEDFISADDYDGAFEMPQVTKSTLLWLDKAGYIWLTRPKYYGAAYSAVLSPKGLEVLKSIPKSIDPSKTLGEKIVEFSKGKFNEALNQTIKIAITEGSRFLDVLK
jgi:hypothetical protein